MKGDGKRSAVLYARVSSKEQEEEGYSIPAQEKLLREYAERVGLQVVREFVDVETAKEAGRAQFGEMVRFLGRKDSDCRVLLVEKTDRLYRNPKDWVTVEELGVEVHFVKEAQVLSKDSKSSDKLMHGIRVVMAKHFIDNLREETTKGMREKAAQGEWPTKSPIGYRNVRGPDGRSTLQVDPEAAAHVRRLFEQFATGQWSVKQLTRKATEEGLVYRRSGKLVAEATVHTLLRNPLFKGVVEWEGKSHPGRHEALVSVDLWERVQGVMDGHRRGNEVRGRRGLPFGGLLTCGHCGCALTGEAQKGGRYVYYHCTQSRGECRGRYARQEELEAGFGEYLRRLRFDEEVLALVRQALQESHADEMAIRRETVARLRGQEDRLRARASLLYEDRLERRIDVGEYDRRHAEVREALAGVQRELARLDAAEEDYLAEGALLLELASRAYDLYTAQPASEKRRLVNLVFLNCTWKDGVLSADYREPFGLLAVASAEGEGTALAGGASGAERSGWYP
jgi:site-specific DNA recombinase